MTTMPQEEPRDCGVSHEAQKTIHPDYPGTHASGQVPMIGTAYDSINAVAKCLFEPNDIVELRRWKNNAGSAVSSFYPARKLATEANRLAAENAKGLGIYFGANPRKSAGGKKDTDVALARSVFVDFDKCELADARLRIEDATLPSPTLLVKSGGGVHAYWRFTELLTDMATARRYQQGLAAMLDSDQKVSNASRVMRMPGFVNHKYPAPCEIVEAVPDQVYDVSEFAEALKARPSKPEPVGDIQTNGRTIPEGERDDTLYRKGCAMRGAGFDEPEIRAALDEMNKCCEPPLDAAQVAKIVGQVCKHDRGTRTDSKGKSHRGREPKQADRLIELAKDAGVKLWHNDHTTYATIPVEKHRENYEIGMKLFRQWLARLYYDATSSTPSAQANQEALAVLAAMAQFEGASHDAFVRIASVDDAIYVDLADDKWRAIKVTADGWSVVSDSPVKFRRAGGMMPLPVPVKGGNLDDLRRFLNYGDEDQFRLMVAWLFGCFMLRGPFPILEIGGEQGSAKSTACRVLRRLVDPNEADLRSAPRDERDLAISGYNSRVIGFDNLSGVTPQISDAICRISTGGGFATRTLYKDDEERIFAGMRPVIVNGIDNVARRPDLMERTIRVTLPTITTRESEKSLWAEFFELRPKLFGALLDAVVVALGRIDSIQLEKPSRMMDFEQWVVAAEPALPWTKGAFVAAYSKNRGQTDRDAIESSPIGATLVALIDDKYTGLTVSPTKLLGDLRDQARDMYGDECPDYDPAKSVKDWPRNPRELRAQLNRIAPNLRALGYTLDLNKRTKDGRFYEMRAPTNYDRVNQCFFPAIN